MCPSCCLFFSLSGWLLSPRAVPEWLPAPSFCWSTAGCTPLGAGWGQQPSAAMQAHPHPATVQSWTEHRTNGLGEQQGLENIWEDVFLIFVAFGCSVSMNPHNFKFKKAPLHIYFYSEQHTLLFRLVTEIAFYSLSTQPIRRQSSLIAGIFPRKYEFFQRI